MAYPVATGAIAELQYRYTIANQQCINVFHYRLQTDIIDGGAWMINAITNWMDTLGVVIQSYQTSEVTQIHVRGQWVYPTRYVAVEYTPADSVGGDAAPAVSIGTSIVMRRRSEVASRSARGRIYIGGVSKARTDVGTIKDIEYGGINGNLQPVMLSSLVDPGPVISALAVIWSYSDPTHSDEVVTAELDPNLRYQRRREVGRGI